MGFPDGACTNFEFEKKISDPIKGLISGEFRSKIICGRV